MESPVQLHVSGLDSGVSEADIRGFFGRFERIIQRFHRSRDGYCFLHFGEDLETATVAIEELDGQICLGRTIKVRFATSTMERYGLTQAQNQMLYPILNVATPSLSPGVLPANESIQVHVSGLNPNTTAEDLKEFFHSFVGHFVKAYCKATHGYAFVHMDSISAAMAAVKKLNGKIDKFGNKLHVALSSETALRYGQPSRTPKPADGLEYDGYKEVSQDDDRVQLYVGGLTAEVSEDDIWQVFEGCPVLKVHRAKDTYCFIHLPDINTALDVMRDKDNSTCGSRNLKVSLSTPACRRYGVPPQPHRKPQLLLRGIPPGATPEDISVFLAEHASYAEEVAPVCAGEWSIVFIGVSEALHCLASLDGKSFLGSVVEVRLSDASSRCLNMPPRPNHKHTS